MALLQPPAAPGAAAATHEAAFAKRLTVVASCPRCATAHDELKREAVRVVFRHLALKAKDPRAVALALAAQAAAGQGAFWPFHDSLFADQGRTDDPHLWARVEDLGLDLELFERDRRGDRVRRDTREALRAGAPTTPTIFR